MGEIHPSSQLTLRTAGAITGLAQFCNVTPDEVVAVLSGVVMKNATSAEMIAFAMVARAYNLDPLKREIYAFKNKDGVMVARSLVATGRHRPEARTPRPHPTLPKEIAMSESATTLGPGLHAGIPAKQYHALNLCSSSRLRTLSNLTPMHLRHELDSEDRRETLEMRMGTALHTLVLEGEEAFAAQYAIGGPINETSGKPFGSDTKKFAEWQSMQMLKRGVVDCFNHYDGDAIRHMANAIWAHEDAGRYLRACKERELTVVGELHGTMCKGRIDGYGILDGEEIMVDIKTTSRETSPEAFERIIAARCYDIQASMYENLLYAHSRPVKHTIFIAVESGPPYAVACYRMRNATLTLMEQYLPTLIEQYTACVQKDEWPGWGTHEVGLPGWRVQQINRVLGVEVR